MNTNPNARVVLCFGDSNTFGQRSDDITKGRWPADIRWTGQLQDRLGSDYYVIEEGLSSRTTDLEYKKPGRSGRPYLVSCVQSHNPIDVIILMLGTNDLKSQYNRSANTIAAALGGLLDEIEQLAQNKDGGAPKVILISPIHINDHAQDFEKLYAAHYDHQSALTSLELAGAIENLAKARSCAFVDAALVAKPGADGIHFDKESHARLADCLEAALRKTSV